MPDKKEGEKALFSSPLPQGAYGSAFLAYRKQFSCAPPQSIVIPCQSGIFTSCLVWQHKEEVENGRRTGLKAYNVTSTILKFYWHLIILLSLSASCCGSLTFANWQYPSPCCLWAYIWFSPSFTSGWMLWSRQNCLMFDFSLSDCAMAALDSNASCKETKINKICGENLLFPFKLLFVMRTV